MNPVFSGEPLVPFTLWLELEHVDYSSSRSVEVGDARFPEWNIKNEFCNVGVDFPDGRHYGINVWTYGFLATAIALDAENGQNLRGSYQIPPDLFVKELTRACIEAAVADLLKHGNLEEVLNPTVLAKSASD